MPAKSKPAWAAVNIIGPDGVLLLAGQPIPDRWHDDYVDSLVESGGATHDAPKVT